MVRLCGASLGLFAFAVTIILGLSAGNLPETILLRAVWAMFVFCVVGWSVGWVARRVIEEHVCQMRAASTKAENEATSLSGSSKPAQGPTGGGGDVHEL